MCEETELFVGIDICEDFVQLTYYDSETGAPESVSRDGGEEQYLIPARLAYRKKKNDWIIGDGLDNEDPDEIAEVKNFFKIITNVEKINVYGNVFEADKLMAIFIECLLKILHSYCSFVEIRCIGITFPVVTRDISAMLDSAFRELGISKDRYLLLNHDESFLHYTLNQPPELWSNDTALFELEDDGLHFRILSIDKKLDPMIAKINRHEKAENLTTDLVRRSKNESVNMFYTLSLMALGESVVSTIYAVGRGFMDNWADGILRKLSPGRRIFRGQNLYAKGCCLAARKPAYDEKESAIFMGDDTTTAGYSIFAVKDGKNREISLMKPSVRWYEAEAELDVIMKCESELGVQRKDYTTGKTERKFISLSGVNGAESGMTRIRLTLKFKDRDTCIIKASDLGFGSFVPTTNRVWELIWEK